MEEKMTDDEAFELLVKYGGEQSLSLIKEMIHEAGMDTAIENTVKVYEKRHKKVGQDFRDWLRQSFEYLIRTSESGN